MSSRIGSGNPCPTCGGNGVRLYGNGATWHTGMVGVASMTPDLCDSCWGSGDAGHHFTDLRDLESRHALAMAHATLESWVEKHVSSMSAATAVDEIISALRPLLRRRKNPLGFWEQRAVDRAIKAFEKLREACR